MGTPTFFPENGNYAEARIICSTCPVIRQCLEMALSFDEDDYGMFGGKTPRERGAIKWQRMKAH